ncbi:MAG: ATP-binding cassette domain-containing protein [Deltaproteobacteria bacterium]|nr:ATP-binding cassette domain-containing protein [Deltaproteobacteria bacterium]
MVAPWVMKNSDDIASHTIPGRETTPDETTSDETTSEALLTLEGLDVTLPDGTALFRSLSLHIAAGEIVVLLGGSGAGKSTLLRTLFEPHALRAADFDVTLDRLDVTGSLGLVPQHGALFDHLDVAGNLRLAHRQRQRDAHAQRDTHAQRNTPRPLTEATSPEMSPDEAIHTWLRDVDLPEELARPGTSVARLSGGQAQRVAVARTLAGGRRMLVLDEPSVGLDPLRIEKLIALLRDHAARGVGLLVVTHDLDFACGVADRLLLLDPILGALRPLVDDWAGPLADDKDLTRAATRRDTVRAALVEALAAPRRSSPTRPRHRRLATALRRGLGRQLGAFRIPGAVLLALPTTLRYHLRDVARVFGRTLSAALFRPAPFYAIVAAILGYTVLYVIARAMPEGLRVGRAIELVGGSYILALTPPLCAFLFSSTSGSALNAWLGTMDLTRQTAALEALGIRRDVYLWTPVWLGLTLAFLVVAAIFAGSMAAGGAYQAFAAGVANPWPLLLGDLLDPAPERWMLRTRAMWLLGLYAVGIAADVVHRGTLRKDEAAGVTRAMTASVISTTLWVVSLELITALAIWRR